MQLFELVVYHPVKKQYQGQLKIKQETAQGITKIKRERAQGITNIQKYKENLGNHYTTLRSHMRITIVYAIGRV